MSGPNYNVIDGDWRNLSIIIADLSRIIDEKKSFTDYLLKDGTRALTADWDAGTHNITANTFTSDVAIGTKPLTITSTTLCDNLNADLLDGQHGAYYSSAATAVTASAIITDNTLVRGDGGARGVQGSSILIDDSNNMSGVASLALTTPLSVPNGGTGLATLATGYIPYGNGTGALNSSANLTFGSNILTVNGLSLASGSITDSTGTISFDNENLSTSGTLGCGFTTVSGNIIVNQANDTQGFRVYGYDDLSTSYLEFFINGSGSGVFNSTQNILFSAVGTNKQIYFRSNGSGRIEIQDSGTGMVRIAGGGGQTRIVGNLRVGADTTPTVALDITGAALISSTLGITGLTTATGGVKFGTAASDPQDATPANRPAGEVAQTMFYNGKLYFCTNAATPTWELITSA